MTTKEAARRLGVSHARVRHLIAEGRIKAEPQGRRFSLIREEELARFAAIPRKAGRPRRPPAAGPDRAED